MNDLTFNILKIVVSVVAALVAVYVIPYLKTLKDNEKYASLVDMVQVAVYAAEQTIKTGGEFKKSEVTAFVSNWLRGKGMEISAEQLSQLIESAVFQMKRGA